MLEILFEVLCQFLDCDEIEDADEITVRLLTSSFLPYLENQLKSGIFEMAKHSNLTLTWLKLIKIIGNHDSLVSIFDNIGE